MNVQVLGLRNDAISPRKMFVLLVLVEAIIMYFMLWGDRYTIAYFLAIAMTPLLLLLIPIEPVIGIPFMLIATGFDFFAQIDKMEDQLFNLTYFHIIMLITFVAVVLNSFLRRKTSFPTCSLWAPMIAFLVMIAISLIYTPHFMVGFLELFRLAVLLTLAFVIMISIDNKGKLEFVVGCLIVIPLGVSLFTMYEIVTEGAFFASQINRMATDLGLHLYRSTGTFHNPNDLACFLMIGITTAFAVIFLDKIGTVMKIVLLAVIGVISIGMIASFSRGGWLSTFSAIFILIALHRKWSYFALMGGLFMVIVFILLIKYPELVMGATGRLLTIFNPASEDSSSSRISLIRTGFWMWQDHPLFGVGAGGFPYYAYDYIDPAMPRALAIVDDPHTVQSKILSEEGLIGFVLAAWAVITVLFEGLRSIPKIQDDFLRKIQIGMTALYCGFVVNFTFASDLFNNTFWMTVGIIYAIPLIAQNIEKKRDLGVPADF